MPRKLSTPLVQNSIKEANRDDAVFQIKYDAFRDSKTYIRRIGIGRQIRMLCLAIWAPFNPTGFA